MKLKTLTQQQKGELKKKLAEYEKNSKDYNYFSDEDAKESNELYEMFKSIMTLLLSQIGEVTDVKRNKASHWSCAMYFKVDGKAYKAKVYSMSNMWVNITAIEDAADIYDYNSGKYRRYHLGEDMLKKFSLPKHRQYNIGDIVIMDGKVKYITGFIYHTSSIEYYLHDKILPKDVMYNNRFKYYTYSESRIKPLKGGL